LKNAAVPSKRKAAAEFSTDFSANQLKAPVLQ
jgi:hypothetical protein